MTAVEAGAAPARATPARTTPARTTPVRTTRDATEQSFRQELREFFREHHPGRAPRDPAERLAQRRTWAGFLVDTGYAGPAWPGEWGGMDLPLLRQVIYHEEAAAARVPRHPSPNLGTVGPTLILHGTDAQRRRFLLPMLRGDELWAQGFSEPGAGSDLASLTTRAERDGDDYVVTGQKVWSSAADVSEWMFALVRTGPPGSGKRGISYLLVDLAGDGVEVRPLRDLTGRADFCEVFFHEVRVPVANRVGEEHRGWDIARTSLGHERVAAAVVHASRYQRVVDELVALARRSGATSDPVVRQRLGRLAIAVRLLTLNSSRVLAAVTEYGEPGPISSVSRLGYTAFEQELHEVAVSILGPYGMLAGADPHAVERGRWAWGFLRTRASTIGAGTAEIQRNTIAERVLGLPREPDAERDEGAATVPVAAGKGRAWESV